MSELIRKPVPTVGGAAELRRMFERVVNAETSSPPVEFRDGTSHAAFEIEGESWIGMVFTNDDRGWISLNFYLPLDAGGKETAAAVAALIRSGCGRQSGEETATERMHP